jgi:uncharacterized membrane protein
MNKPSSGNRWAGYIQIRETPVSDLLVTAFGVGACAVVLTLLPPDRLFSRALFGLPLLFFFPGYAIVAALYPASSPRKSETGAAAGPGWSPSTATFGAHVSPLRRSHGDRIGWRARLALSFGVSVAVLPFLGLVLGASGVGFGQRPAILGLGSVVVAGLAVAVVRRSRLPESERFHPPTNRYLLRRTGNRFNGGSLVDSSLNVVLAALVLISILGVGYTAATPNNAESYTSVALLTETNSGELVANGYPETLDESAEPLVLEIENLEGERIDYVVLVELQRVTRADGSLSVEERSRVDRLTPTVSAGDTWTDRHTVEPSLEGEDLRLVYYLYTEEAPETPSAESAYRTVHIWVDAPSGGDS